MTVNSLDKANIVAYAESYALTLNLCLPTYPIKPDSTKNCFSSRSIDMIIESAVGVPSLKETGTMLY